MGEEKIGETARGTQNCQGEKRLGGVWKWWDRSPGTGLRLWSPAHDSWFCLQTSPINKNPHISLLDSLVPTIPTLLSNHHLWPLPPSSSLSPSSSSSIGGSLLISFLPSDSEGWSVWLYGFNGHYLFGAFIGGWVPHASGSACWHRVHLSYFKRGGLRYINRGIACEVHALMA